MAVTNTSVAQHYTWGDACDGWRLLDAEDLSVIEEMMPPRTQEVRHAHSRAHQMFYVLIGTLTMDIDGKSHTLGPGDALNIRPGQAHQARNDGESSVRFLVISAPTTRGDRVDAPV